MTKEQALQVFTQLVQALAVVKPSPFSYEEVSAAVKALEALKAPAPAPLSEGE
jgi:hypothetical protein